MAARVKARQVPAGRNARIVRKTADEGPLASNTTLQNDDHLKVPMAANDVVCGTLRLIYDGGSAGDFAGAFVGPAGCEIDWSVIAARTTDAAATSVGFSSSVISSTGTTATSKGMGTFGAGVKVAATISFEARNSGTAGDLQFQWAQAVSDATGATVYRGSRIEYQVNP